MLDDQGYPLQESLDALKEFDLLTGSLENFLDLLYETWNYADSGGFRIGRRSLQLNTGGWSGNEEVIKNLSSNFVFWACFWQSSLRGGRYNFRFEGRYAKECRAWKEQHNE